MLRNKDILQSPPIGVIKRDFTPDLGRFPTNLERSVSLATNLESPIPNLYSRVLAAYREDSGLNILKHSSEDLSSRLASLNNEIRNTSVQGVDSLAVIKINLRNAKKQVDNTSKSYDRMGFLGRTVYDVLSHLRLSSITERIIPLQSSRTEFQKLRLSQIKTQEDLSQKNKEQIDLKVRLQEEKSRLDRNLDQEFVEWLFRDSERVLAYALSELSGETLQRERLFQAFAQRNSLDLEAFSALIQKYQEYSGEDYSLNFTLDEESNSIKEGKRIKGDEELKNGHIEPFRKEEISKSDEDKEVEPRYPLGLVKRVMGGFAFELFDREELIANFILKESKNNNAIKQDLTEMIEYLRKEPFGPGTKSIPGRSKRKQPNIFLGSKILTLRSLNPNDIPDYIPVHKESDQRRITYVVDPNGNSPKVYIRKIYHTHREYDKDLG